MGSPGRPDRGRTMCQVCETKEVGVGDERAHRMVVTQNHKVLPLIQALYERA